MSNGQGREADLAREAVVREQPDVVAGRRVHLRAPPLRQGAVARRGRDLDVSLVGRERRPAGHRAEWLAEGCRRARHLARRPLPLLQQGRHARPDVRIQQGSERHDLRDHAARPVNRSRAARGQRAGRIGRRRRSRPTASHSRTSAAFGCRAFSTCATSRPAATVSSSATSTRTCRKRGRSTASTRNTRGPRTANRSSSGAKARSGASTSPAARGSRFRSAPTSSRRSTPRVRSRRRCIPAEFPVKMLRDVRVSPDGKHVVFSALGHLYSRPLPRVTPASG